MPSWTGAPPSQHRGYGSCGRSGPEIAGALLAAGKQSWAAPQRGRVLDVVCAAPIPAASGKTVRHHLNRAGNRQATTALYQIVVLRLRWHPPPRAQLARRTTEGLSTREIIRCLKRSVAREIFTAPGSPTAVTNPT